MGAISKAKDFGYYFKTKWDEPEPKSKPYPQRIKEVNRRIKENIGSRKINQYQYSQSRSGKVGGFFSSIFRAGKVGVSRSLYPSSPTSRISKYGRRGRPRGPSGRYYIPGVGAVGVYEYRMWLRSQLREKRAQIQRNMTLSPEQQQALAELQARRQASIEAPENRTIPDTTGRFSFSSYNQEVDDAANMVD